MTTARPSSSPAARAREVLAGLPGRAADRLRQAWVRIALDGVVAVVAFLVAQLLLRQATPIFAPIAAVVCLTDSAEKRGLRAARLLLGVVAGVAVGELARLVIGSGWLQVGAAVVVGMLVVSLGSINPLALLQSGIAALLVVGIGSSQAGWSRLASAIIGGVIALVVSQVLVTPSPVRRFTDAASTALRGIADGLDDVAGALRAASGGDPDAADAARRAAERLRSGHADVAAVLDTRDTSQHLARSTVRGRRERSTLAAVTGRLAGLEYVHAGAVLLARTAADVAERGDTVPTELVDGVADLAGVVRSLAEHPREADPVAGSGRSRDAHGVAESLARTDPDAWPGGPARLATQLHLLAEDVDALTDPPRSQTVG
ncbi:FUSC family protein [Actinomycetospora sp. TBRC 11914]|uniref:FUSC family protein n=1 Tax=Actinomycetospora sp. TBRC 11914 TaxID=2729387 RepID=UPI00145EDD56|nr:FUSC family protein [Actinomycetospora sp. TBRC 11914]NMO89185.1 hypothetical protein [Actinomycetospora sp. TBRC 11914]